MAFLMYPFTIWLLGAGNFGVDNSITLSSNINQSNGTAPSDYHSYFAH
ncbi:MAG: putative peptidase [Paraglaciecola sp.]|jgi:predicted peptidase